MERRKFITGLGALVTGSAAAMGTGAFTSVSADRSVTVNVAADSSAYLGLTSDSEYTTTSDGKLQLDLGATTSGTGSGLNEDATTSIREVFTVTNQGTEPVAVYIDSSALNDAMEPGENTKSNQIHFFVGDPGGSSIDTYDPNSLVDANGDFKNPTSEPRIIGAGNSVDVGLYVVNNGTDWSDLSEDITVSAYDDTTLANNDVGPANN